MTHDETMDAGRLAQWREAMLGEGSLRLQSLGRNYLGLGKVGRDKGKVVSGLAAMMSDPEVQQLKGRVVIIAANDRGTQDRHPSPRCSARPLE